jgi:hypothetical protein
MYLLWASMMHAKPSERAKLLNGVPLAQLLRGLHQIRAVVAGDQARIAFLRNHPGILPAQDDTGRVTGDWSQTERLDRYG